MKGQMKTVEAFIASIILLSTVAWLLGISPKIPEFESIGLKFAALKVLRAMDENNELRGAAYSNNVQRIESEIEEHIPKVYEVEVLICRENETCELDVEAKNIFSVSYLLATDFEKLENREIVVYIYEI